jgi:hypothetical protein
MFDMGTNLGKWSSKSKTQGANECGSSWMESTCHWKLCNHK